MEPGPLVVIVTRASIEVGSSGLVPSRYSCKLLTPSWSASPLALCEVSPNQANSQQSGMPSLSLSSVAQLRPSIPIVNIWDEAEVLVTVRKYICAGTQGQPAAWPRA